MQEKKIVCRDATPPAHRFKFHLYRCFYSTTSHTFSEITADTDSFFISIQLYHRCKAPPRPQHFKKSLTILRALTVETIKEKKKIKGEEKGAKEQTMLTFVEVTIRGSRTGIGKR